MTYFILYTMKFIEAFSYGYGKEDGNQFVYRFDTLAATATAINIENELNFTRYIKYDDDIFKFVDEFSNAIRDAQSNVPYNKIPGLDDMNKVNITCIPWLSFTNFKDAIDYKEKSSKPKICWGKYYLEKDKYMIDISILVNHAFQDGYHIGLFFYELQQNIYNIEIQKNLIRRKEIEC